MLLNGVKDELQKEDYNLHVLISIALIDHMQLKEAQILRPSPIGRATEPDGEVPHGTDVPALGLGLELTVSMTTFLDGDSVSGGQVS